MKLKRLAYVVSVAIGGIGANNGYALDLYMDSKTKQIYAEPGPGRVKLGNFEKVDEEAGEASKTAKKSAKSKPEGDQIKAVEDRLNKKIDALANKPKAPDEAKVTINEKGVRFQTNDGNFKFSLNGRLHADAAIHNADKYVTYTDTDNNGSRDAGETATRHDLTDGTEIRRFRMEFAAQFYNDWLMKLQPDFANEQLTLKDAYVQYTGLDWGTWTIGQSKQPYSLQQMMSSNDMVFMERSLEYVWTDEQVDRAIGIRYDVSGNNWSAAAGWYGDAATRQAESSDEGWGAAGRATWAPWFKPGEVIHIGASGAYRTNRDANKTIHYRIRPTRIDQSSVSPLDTGNITNVEDMAFFNAEAAGAYGPVSFEGEYNLANLLRSSPNGGSNTGTGDSKFDGWHLDLAYSLTGESRASAYDPKQGVFKRLTPNRNFDLAGGWGAWELKGRVEQVNLNKVGTPGQHGGRQTDVVFGVNWYLNPWFRLMLDYTHVLDIDLGNAGTRRTLSEGDPSDFDVVQMRGSLAF